MQSYAELRAAKDHFFKFDRHSPLTPHQRQDFEALEYFPPDPSLRFEVDVARDPGAAQISIETSTGDEQVYTRFGTFDFEVDGQPARLAIYANQHGFFLPFVDALAGTETYGAGRYLEPEVLRDGRFLVDFNLAYNPYCAYNPNWSCPLTPFENRLKVAIRAGEKDFAGHDQIA
jgi:uncharacterized protein